MHRHGLDQLQLRKLALEHVRTGVPLIASSHGAISRAVTGLLVAIATTAATACSHRPEGPELPPASAALYQELLVEAESLDVSPEQLTVLREAIDSSRYVTFEEYRRAREAEISCLRDLGFDIAEYRETDHGSWIEITFLYGGFPDQASGEALLDDADTCAIVEAQFVALAYEERGRVGGDDVEFADFASAIISCLEERGESPPEATDQATILELDYTTTARLGEAATCAELVGFTPGN